MVKCLHFFDLTTFYDWPNSLECTNLNQCGARRDAELCRLCYKQTLQKNKRGVSGYLELGGGASSNMARLLFYTPVTPLNNKHVFLPFGLRFLSFVFGLLFLSEEMIF